MRERANEQTASWRQRGHSLAFVGGVAIGYATLGTIGFEGRLEYAAVGSVTNQASALCANADAGQILATERVISAVRELVQTEHAADDGPMASAAYAVLGLKGPVPDRPVESGPLSAREREVAALIARGRTNRQIAEELVIAERTVAAHVEHIMTKLDFASRTQIGVWAAERGLLHARGGSSS